MKILVKQIVIIFSIRASDTIELLVILFMIKLIAQVNIFKINIAFTDLMKRYPKLQDIETLYHQSNFAAITSLSEFYFRFRRFILLLQPKKVISVIYGSSTSS